MATDKTTAIAERKQPSEFELQMADYTPQFAAALPSHVPLEKFKRVVLTAINQNQNLARADRRSLFNSCVAAAQDGLYPDGREAALVIFRAKEKGPQGDRWVDKVQYMPMVAGVRKRMRNSGEVTSAVAHVVFKNDYFDYELGDEPSLSHKPALADRGEPIGAYAIIKLTNGEVIREYMSKDEIEQVRSVSRAKDNGPWVGWWGEMARKTVLRRAAKAAPSSADLDTVLSRDDALLGDDIEPRDITPPARPTRSDFDPAAAGHADPDQEYRQAMGEVVTDDGEIIEPEDENQDTTESPAGDAEASADDPTTGHKSADAGAKAATDAPAGGGTKPELIPLPKVPATIDGAIVKNWCKIARENAKHMDAAAIAKFRADNAAILAKFEEVHQGHHDALQDALNERLDLLRDAEAA